MTRVQIKKDNTDMAIKKLQGERERQEGIYYEFDTQGTLLGEGSTGYVFHGKKVTEATGETHDVAIKFLYNDLSEESIVHVARPIFTSVTTISLRCWASSKLMKMTMAFP